MLVSSGGIWHIDINTTAHPYERQNMNDQRAQARAIFKAGVSAADPYECVFESLDHVPEKPTQIIAVGKAAVRMAAAAQDAYPKAPVLVVTNYENAQVLEEKVPE